MKRYHPSRKLSEGKLTGDCKKWAARDETQVQRTPLGIHRWPLGPPPLSTALASHTTSISLS